MHAAILPASRPAATRRLNARSARAALLATCLMVCGSAAWSQSPQYKRGYDDGFQAGRESVLQHERRAERRDDRRDEQAIRVLDARYGRGRQVCDAGPAVQQFLDQRGQADGFEVSNELCGDPAPNQTKSLTVTYQCGGSDPVRVSANEGNALRIRCR